MPAMPRTKRMYTSGVVCHVLNRAVGRAEIFRSTADYAAFERLLAVACEAVPVRLLTLCLMPNHWHLVLWPQADRGLSVFMHRLTMTHTMRWHHAHHTMGTGPLYQGRFKSFPVASDEHFLTVCRYVERNALRANLVPRAEDWRWSGLWHRTHPGKFLQLSDWPVGPSEDWVTRVNQPHTKAESGVNSRSPALRSSRHLPPRFAMKPTAGSSILAAALIVSLVLLASLSPSRALADELPKDTNQIERLTPEQAKKLAAEFPGVRVVIEGNIGTSFIERSLPLNGLDPSPVSAPALMRELGNSPRGVSEGGA